MGKAFDKYVLRVGRLSNMQILRRAALTLGVLIGAPLLLWGCWLAYGELSVRIDEGEVIERDYDAERDHWHPPVQTCTIYNKDGFCIIYNTTPGHNHFHAADCDIKVRGQDATSKETRIEEQWIDVSCSAYDDYPIGSTWRRNA